jgi:hypothetical protein
MSSRRYDKQDDEITSQEELERDGYQWGARDSGASQSGHPRSQSFRRPLNLSGGEYAAYPQHPPIQRGDNYTLSSYNSSYPPLPVHANFASPGAANHATSAPTARYHHDFTNDKHLEKPESEGDMHNFGAVRKKAREKERRAELSAMFKALANQLEKIEQQDLDPEVLDDDEEDRKRNHHQQCFGNAVPTNRIYLIARSIEVIETMQKTNEALKRTVENLRAMKAKAEQGNSMPK